MILFSAPFEGSAGTLVFPLKYYIDDDHDCD